MHYIAFISGQLICCLSLMAVAGELTVAPATIKDVQTQKTKANAVRKKAVSAEVLAAIKGAFGYLQSDPALAAQQAEAVLANRKVLPDKLLCFTLWIQGSGLAISEDHPRALDVLSEAEDVARNCKDQKTLRRILRYKAASCFECSRFEDGRAAAHEALLISKQLGDLTAYVALLHNESASNEFALGNVEVAMDHLNKAVEISESCDDTKGVCKWLVNASNFALELKQYDQAIEFCNRVLKLEGEDSTSFVTAAAHCTLGETLLHSGMHAKSMQHLATARELSQVDGAAGILASTESALGRWHVSQQDFAKAIAHHTRALKIFRRLKNPSGIASAEQALRDLESSGDPLQYVDEIRRELARAEESGELKLQLSLHEELAGLLATSGDLRQSATHAIQASGLNSHLQSASFNKQIAAALLKLSHSEKLRLIEDLQAESTARGELLRVQQRWNNSLIAVVCVMLIVVVVVGALLYLMRKALREVQSGRESLKQQKQVQLQMERQLAERQKSESLSLMASGIAHDFNNLLSAIVGLAELATVTGSVTKKDGLLKQISETSLQASGLTGQLMQFLGQPTSDCGHCDVISVLGSTEGLLQSMARPNVVQVQHPSGPLQVQIDETRVRQILVNLVANAAEATEGNQQINVTVETVDMSADEIIGGHGDSNATAGSYCRIVVKDSGHGMSDETKARLFDPYFSTKGVGRGLGLSSVIGIVRSCGGFVHVKSAPDSGCEFALYLKAVALKEPSKQVPEKTLVMPSPNIELNSQRHVMIVDDEQMIREMQSQYLRMMGFEVSVATSAEEALRLAEGCSKAIDCYVTDFCMGGKDGRWLAKQIKLLQPHVPIILCSGYSSEALEPDQDVTTVLTKPYSPKLLAATINQCLLDVNPSRVDSGGDQPSGDNKSSSNESPVLSPDQALVDAGT